MAPEDLFFSAAIDIQNEINGTSKLYGIPGRMLLVRKDSIKKSMICVHPKMHPSKIFEIENFRKFSISKIFIFIQFSMKNFDEHFRRFFDLKIFGDRFQNALTFFIINRFGRDFFQSCVDFHGGDDGIEIRAI